MIKISVFLTRRADVSLTHFSAYWKEHHWPLLLSQPEVKDNTRHYIQVHRLPEDLPGIPTAPYDGIAELWVDDLAAVAAIFTSDNYNTIIVPDEATFIDRSKTLLMFSTENRIL